MIWGIIWIACGIFSAIVASSKGRSGFGWLVLGLIFGVFALLAVGFMPAVKTDNAMQKTGQPPVVLERKCPFCAEIIKAEAIVCKHCGRDVEPVAIDEAAAPPTKFLTCPHCGAVLGENKAFCHKCQKETGLKICPHCGADCSEYPMATACHACKRFFNERQ